MVQRLNRDSPEDWLVHGGVAYDGMSYGPPTSAVSWGTPGCPLAPSIYRSTFATIEVPSDICEHMGATNLTMADLTADAWREWEAIELSPECRRSLGALFYRLPVPEQQVAIRRGVPGAWLRALPTSPRTRNALHRYFSRKTAHDSAQVPMSCEDVLSIGGVGRIALVQLLCVLESSELDTSSDAISLPSRKIRAIADLDFEAAVREASRKVAINTSLMGSHLREFATWALNETRASTLGDAIRSEVSAIEPAAPWQRLADLQLAELVEAVPHPYDVIQTWAFSLPDRERFIFSNRTGNVTNRRTLQELAEYLGITRERVRQIEAKMLMKFNRFLRLDVAAPIRWRIETLKRRIGVAAPLEEIQPLLQVGPGQSDYSALLLRRAGPYDFQSGWIVLSATLPEDPTDRIADMADEYGFIDESSADSELAGWGIDPSYQRQWVTRNGVIREVHGKLVRWGSSVGDRVATGLALLGSPATIETVLDHIREQTTRNNALNALHNDPRVVRVSRTEWALASWGLPQYNSIAGAIGELLRRSGTPKLLEEIVEQLCKDFGVAEASIRAYCFAPMFVVDRGIVRLRSESEPFQYGDAPIKKARGMFRLGPHRVSILMRVDEDVLRGSGRSMAMAAGSILNIPIGQLLSFAGGNGISVGVTFPPTSFLGPSLGSVRALADSLDARLGDYLTVTLDRIDMSVTGVATQIGEHVPGWELVSRLTGIDADAAIAGLGRALGCQENDVLFTLRARGDDVVAQAIPKENSPSERLEKALERLESQLGAT